jgi:hypothetical protein
MLVRHVNFKEEVPDGVNLNTVGKNSNLFDFTKGYYIIR